MNILYSMIRSSRDTSYLNHILFWGNNLNLNKLIFLQLTRTLQPSNGGSTSRDSILKRIYLNLAECTIWLVVLCRIIISPPLYKSAMHLRDGWYFWDIFAIVYFSPIFSLWFLWVRSRLSDLFKRHLLEISFVCW